MKPKDAERTKKEHPDTLCISTDPVHKEKTHDEQSRAAPEETVPEEIESMEAPPDTKTSRSLRTCLSRGAPTDHDARIQVKVKKKRSSCRKKTACRIISIVETAACNTRKKRQNKTRDRSWQQCEPTRQTFQPST